MNLTRLRYFVAVAEELHFGRAAERLRMAQPPLSQQLRRLEAVRGVELFRRSTRRVALTEAGRLLLPEARALLDGEAALDRTMAAFRDGEGGTLRLGFVDSAAYEVLPRFLRAYRQRWPEVTYELSSMSSDQQHQALVGGAIDLGIGRTKGGSDEIEATTIRQERLVLAVDADHHLARQQSTTLTRLRAEEFVGFDHRVSPTLHGELAALLGGRGIGYTPTIEATEYTTILGLVASGQGVAIVPSGVQSFAPPGLRYLRLNDRDAVSSLLLLERTETRSALVEHARTLVADLF